MVVRLTAAAGAPGAGCVLVPADTSGVVSAAVLRELRHRAEAGDPRSKLRTNRHARATIGVSRDLLITHPLIRRVVR